MTGTAHALRDVRSTRFSLGGNDTIISANGDKVVIGGFGLDTVTIDAVSTSNRFIVGDNGTITFDTMGGMTDQVTTDTLATTGNNDTILIGHATATSNTTNVGINVIEGGMGADSITVLGVGATGTSFDTILGDNGEVHRNSYAVATAYALRDVHSTLTLMSLGGNDSIFGANGDKVILGGFGADTITLKTSSESTRYIAGDNAQVTFDTYGGMTDFYSTDVADATGGADVITLIDLGSGSVLGTNFIIGGMGADKILVTGSIDPVSGKIRSGGASSEDVLIGDNGEIHRTAKSSPGDSNWMLKVASLVPDKGGADIIATGNGGKVIIGGLFDDILVAANGDNLVVGDNAVFDYDTSAQNGILRQITNTDTVIGGNDTITLEEGFKVVLGGAANDTIDIVATGLGIAGSFTASGANSVNSRDRRVTGIDRVTMLASTDSSRLGRSGRYVVGDNAQITFDLKGGLTGILSTDAISSTGGDDAITVGTRSILGTRDAKTDLGYQVVIGGMGSDTITFPNDSDRQSEDVIAGDNVEYLRKALDYKAISLISLVPNQGGDDRILSGSGVKTVIGGFGNDTVTLNTVMVSTETSPSNRSLVMGDSGAINFDPSGSGRLRTVESASFNFGGADTVTIGDGDVTFIGGYGVDVLKVDSTQTAFRAVAGDNARFSYGVNASNPGDLTDPSALTQMISLDSNSTTGDGDNMRLGTIGSISGQMGIALAMGGMGIDTLTLTGGTAVHVAMAGDNADIFRTAGRTGVVTSFQSLLPDQGAGDIMQTISGTYLLAGGQGADTIRAGSGFGVVFGDSGRATFASGLLQDMYSLGESQGGNDAISLGSGGATDDGDKYVIGGYGSDTISVVSVRGNGTARERAIAGDNSNFDFDTTGHLTGFNSVDPDPSTGGIDEIILSIAGDPLAGNPIYDNNIIAGGPAGDNIQVLAAARTHDVISGDNLSYQRSDGAPAAPYQAYQDLYAAVSNATTGGDDFIRTGTGYKLVFGGTGNDRIDTQTAPGDTNVVFGDAGEIGFGGNGRFQQLVSSATSIGGNDTIGIGAGNDFVFGGFGNDTISVSAADNVMRPIFGDSGQVDFDVNTGALTMVQTTGSDAADPLSTRDDLTLPSVGTNLVFGGTGNDTLAGSTGANYFPLPGTVGANYYRVPGSGSIADPASSGRVLSVTMLGYYGEFGIVDPNIVGPDPNAPAGGGTVTQTNTGNSIGTGAVAEDGVLTATGRLVYPALTGGSASFIPQTSTVGSFGGFSVLVDGNWTYSLANSQANVQALLTGDLRNDVFQVKTTDGSSTTVTISISGKDDAAIIAGVSTGAVTEDSSPLTLVATGTLTVTDPDASQPKFSPAVTPVGTVQGSLTITEAGVWTYSVSNAAMQSLGTGQTRSEIFRVASQDGSATQSITVTITGVNDTPTGIPAIVGTAAQNQTLTVNTSGISDAEGLGAFSYQWQRFVNGGTVWSDIGGAIATTYALDEADVGNKVRVQVSYTDTTGTAEGPVSSLATAFVANVNDGPSLITIPANFAVTEDVAGNLVYAGTPFADVDSSSLTVTLSIADGTITGNSGTGISVSGTVTQRTFTGTTTDLNNYFTAAGNITYTTAQNNTTARTLTTQVSDGNLSNSTTSTINITAVNDAPTLSATAANLTFSEGVGNTPGAVVAVFSGAAVSPVESGQTVTGFTFTVSGLHDGVNEKIVVDDTTITLGATSAGTTTTTGLGYAATISGGMATVVLSGGNLTAAATQLLVNGITYQNTNVDQPTAGNRVFTLTQVKDSGGVANGGVDTTSLSVASTVGVNTVNDAPTLTATALNPTFSEGAGAAPGVAVAVFSGAAAGTVESGQTVTELTFTVSGLVDGANEVIVVDGMTITLDATGTGITTTNGLSYSATVSGGTATVVLSGGTLSMAATQTLVNGITYQNTNVNQPTAGNRVFTLTQVKDSGGIANNGVDTTALSIASTVNVVVVNDAPGLTVTSANPTFTEAAGIGTQSVAVNVFSGAAVNAIEAGQTIKGLTFTVSGIVDGANEKIVVDGTEITLGGNSGPLTTATNGMTYNVTIVSGTATVALTKAAGVAVADVNALINALTYQNINVDQPAAGDRVFTLTQVQDSGGTANSGVDTTTLSLVSTVGVVTRNDAPTLSATGLNPTFTEGAGAVQGAAVTVFSTAAVSTVESGQTVTGLTFIVSGLLDGADESIVVDGKMITLGVTSTGMTTTNNLAYTATVSGGTATVVLSGGTLSTAATQTLVNAITYQNANLNQPTAGNRVFTLTQVKDSGGTANGGGNTTTLSVASTVTVNTVNDAPTLTATALNPTFSEGTASAQGAAVVVFSGATVSTVESGQTITGLTFEVSGLVDGVNEVIVVDGKTITLDATSTGTTTTNSLTYTATVSGGMATVVLSGTLNVAATQSLVNAITYQNTNVNQPTTGNRVFKLTEVKDSGGTADTSTLSLTSTVGLNTVNDAPTLSATALNPTFIEGVGANVQGAAVSVFSGAAVSTVESGQTIKGLTFTVSGLLDDANEVVLVDGQAVTLVQTSTTTTNGLTYNVAVTGGTATVVLSGEWTTAAIQTLVNGIKYQNTNVNQPKPGNRVFTLTQVQDSGGMANGGTDASALLIASTVGLNTVNDAPTLTATALNPAFTEGTGSAQGAAVTMFSNAAVSMVKSDQTVIGLTFTVGGLLDGSKESIVVDGKTIALGANDSGTTTINVMTYSVLLASGSATVALTKVAGVAAANVNVLINGITYQNTNVDQPTTGNRVFTLTQVQASGGTADGGTDSTALSIASTVAVTAVNDAPTLTAIPATFTVTEDVAGNLVYTGMPFADVDSSTLTVTLSIVDGTITGNVVTGITLGGTPTAVTFSGTTADLNTYFTTAGKITYTTASNNNTSRTLTTQVSDGNSSNSSTSTVSITPVNDAATINGVSAATVNAGNLIEDTNVVAGNLTRSGTLSIADVDTGEAKFSAVTIQAALGKLTIAENGNWTYSVANSAVQFLKTGEKVEEVFTVRSVDGTATAQIKVSIIGVDEPAVLVAGDTAAASANTGNNDNTNDSNNKGTDNSANNTNNSNGANNNGANNNASPGADNVVQPGDPFKTSGSNVIVGPDRTSVSPVIIVKPAPDFISTKITAVDLQTDYRSDDSTSGTPGNQGTPDVQGRLNEPEPVQVSSIANTPASDSSDMIGALDVGLFLPPPSNELELGLSAPDLYPEPGSGDVQIVAAAGEDSSGDLRTSALMPALGAVALAATLGSPPTRINWDAPLTRYSGRSAGSKSGKSKIRPGQKSGRKF